MKRSLLGVALLLATVALPVPVEATWSVIAVDTRTGRVVVASATCVAQERLLGFPSKVVGYVYCVETFFNCEISLHVSLSEHAKTE